MLLLSITFLVQYAIVEHNFLLLKFGSSKYSVQNILTHRTQCIIYELATIIICVLGKIINVKYEKRNSIRLFAQSKLDGPADSILQVMQDEDISPVEFHKVLQETKILSNKG